MPIKGLSEVRRLPRLGKIRLGIKKTSQRTGGEYPSATDYFVCPPEVQAVYGEKPKQLDVIIPIEDDEIWANQYYRQYSKTRGLICKGDGEFCRRMYDKQTGGAPDKDTKEAEWKEGIPCDGRDCSDYQSKMCQEVMNLQFILPKVEGLGVWQIDTGSINSIMNINSDAEMIRAMTGRISWIPLILTLEKTEVYNPEDGGKKKTVYCMRLRYQGNAESLLRASETPRRQMLVTRPVDDEAPEDRLIAEVSEVQAMAEDDIEDFYPQEQSPQPVSKPTKSRSSGTEDEKQPYTQEGQKQPENGEEPFIDEDWLRESLEKLQEAGVTGYDDAPLLSYIKVSYKVEADTPVEAARMLPKEKAIHFCDKISESLKKYNL